MFSSAKRREKEYSMKTGDLKDPDALAFYYMDTLLCHEYYLKHEDCTKQYQAKWFFSPFSGAARATTSALWPGLGRGLHDRAHTPDNGKRAREFRM